MGCFECLLHVAEHLLQGTDGDMGFLDLFARDEPILDSDKMSSHLLVDRQSSEGESIQRFYHQWICPLYEIFLVSENGHRCATE